MRVPRVLLVVLFAAVLTAGCGGSSPSTPEPGGTTAPAPRLPTATATATLPAPALLPTRTPAPPPPATATPTAPATATVSPHPSPTLAEPDAPVIVLDPGHDASWPGALGIEYQVVVRSAHVARAALEAAGYRVFLTREDPEALIRADPTLAPANAAEMHPGYSHAYAHASKALQFDPDLVIVLHFNGHPDPAVGGVEVYYCERGGEQNLRLAEITREELVAALRTIGYEPPSSKVQEDIVVARGGRHFPSLGNVYDAPAEFRGNRFAGIPTVLTEPLYMTNATERALIEDDATMQALAEAYVRIVDRWFGR